ncbi:hypothetical protein AB0H71_31600 [Nocardia sp. NPDC050697]|uniref:hypothetical protein n=1 Tax=Nocardia sp. NPDC050697 TaxID=3155158 RepID=UPI0033CCC41B
MVLAVGLSALGVGCGDGGEPGSDRDAATEPLGYGKEVTVPISAAVTTLVYPGEEPRSPLRPHYAVGTVQRVTLRTDHNIEQIINDQQPRDFSNPEITIPMTAEADADGVDLVLGNVTTDDPVLAKALTDAGGSHAGFEMSELGAITALRLAPSPDTSNTARAALEQAFYQAVYRSVTFPDEPVGVGAMWTVRQEVTGGVLLDQVTTATLTERDGDRITLQLDVSQTPKSAVWSLPNDAGTLQIEDYEMTGSGTITVDLGLPLPVAGSITVGGHQAYRDARSDSVLQQTINTQVSWAE